ncbi:hypothetical protein COSHB9_19140 [Companilactobacillus alimentarius]|uniref:Uncharacterized protein n=1 Tax=Companilactobacillus alimentarius DSM 20249 TaxID=1423720 RepID=A0A2K9HKN5_9LACO|nr:hypothetical protein [Companilactobacillus alimentarius]AUI72407.1 hypothetical protein LA20249_09555 [Companilactobacillus alimentarius DSM 20249]MDT6952996.1 hypothetical protein [Companilactobacillus alimentarius]GEO45831.1 hypothetical protein LAL01_20630 [Companilactobacillus alimentarius]
MVNKASLIVILSLYMAVKNINKINNFIFNFFANYFYLQKPYSTMQKNASQSLDFLSNNYEALYSLFVSFLSEHDRLGKNAGGKL